MAMFVVAETHPFTDGNGRTARLIMNSYLSRHGLSRIMIPTVFREDYLLPLKALTNHHDPVPFLAALMRAQRWSAAFDYTRSRDQVQAAMTACHAFEEDLRRYKLITPDVSITSRAC
jgi:fido (protein-threonine AMPylation protein)